MFQHSYNKTVFIRDNKSELKKIREFIFMIHLTVFIMNLKIHDDTILKYIYDKFITS